MKRLVIVTTLMVAGFGYAGTVASAATPPWWSITKNVACSEQKHPGFQCIPAVRFPTPMPATTQPPVVTLPKTGGANP